MRRAMRHGRMLGLNEPFLWKTVSVGRRADGRRLSRSSSPSAARIEEAVRGEEERFAETLDRGMRADRGVRRRAPGAGAGGRRRPASCSCSTTPTASRATWPRRSSRTRGWQVTGETERAFEAEMEAQRERARAGGGVRRRRRDRRAARPSTSGCRAELPPIAVPRLRRRWPRRRAILALVRGRPARCRRRAAGEDGRDHPRPHAGLRRVRRPDGRHRHAGRPARAAARSLDTYYRGAKLIVHRVTRAARAASARTRTWR